MEMMNNTPVNENPPEQRQALLSLPDLQAQEAAARPKRVFSTGEKVLVGVAAGLGLLYDRLALAGHWWNHEHMPFGSAIFWLAFLVLFFAAHWKIIKGRPVVWISGAFSAALCIWNFLFAYRSTYGLITWIVIPAVMMALVHVCVNPGSLKQIAVIAKGWLSGWFIKPFTAIPMFFGAMASMSEKGKNSTLRKIIVGLTVSLPILLVILPLLGSADMVFGYYLGKVFRDFEISSFVGHFFCVVIAALLFYSFLWNLDYAPRKQEAVREKPVIDVTISGIVLGVVILVYLLFCSVQFTYLFAQAGLPGDMTYSEYAREGFAQINVICVINLLLFAIFLHYGGRKKATLALLGTLLCLTGVILFSGFARLRLYINVYGMTWLRMLSMWFIIYLAAVLVLCGVRIAREKLPLIAICGVLLLGWYTTLGYANPDALIVRYNMAAAENPLQWLDKNNTYLRYDLSDDAALALMDYDYDHEALFSPIASHYEENDSYSLSGYRLRQRGWVYKQKYDRLMTWLSEARKAAIAVYDREYESFLAAFDTHTLSEEMTAEVEGTARKLASDAAQEVFGRELEKHNLYDREFRRH